ncbi:hypothetical protein HDU87_007550 [Geranomyces variabilis]|uniref:Guanylate kinase-like domain-containing protein n=1 Tax=Geranomyces variabilis TaxID=109894 RepID=A0AAD5XUV9_9FUNG|nr:hypothetical protein HDU87_007550 [Geranomyces variabilis]
MSAKKPTSRATSASKAKPGTAGGAPGSAAAPASRTSSGKRRAGAKSNSTVSLEPQALSRQGSSLKLSGDAAGLPPLPSAPAGPSAGEDGERPPADEKFEAETVVDEGAEHAKRLEALPLPYEVLRRALSLSGRGAEQMKQVFTKMSLPNAGLSNIGMLKNYPLLQTLELPGNGISDLSVLSSLRYLVQVDLSNNELTSGLDLDSAPYNLQHVDLSRNRIQEISDMSQHRFLMKLCLDRNLISQISGLKQCRYLTHLSLANNSVEAIEGLDGLPLKFIDLRRNHIKSLAGIETLQELEELRVGHNFITSLHNASRLPALRLIDTSYNNLTVQSETFSPLTSLALLRDVDLSGNVVTREPGYRLQAIFALPRLRALDGLPVAVEEKVAATNLYSPSPSVVASVQHAAMMKSWGLRQMVFIRRVELMRAKRLRPIVLCGPSGVGKRSLAWRLIEMHPTIYAAAISHTTRRPRPGEVDKRDYYFTSRTEMEAMIARGEFIQVAVLFGEMYGVSCAALDTVTEAGQIGVMCLELDGVLTLKRSPIKCHYICVTVPDMATLQKRLESRFLLAPPEEGPEPDREDDLDENAAPRPFTEPEFGLRFADVDDDSSQRHDAPNEEAEEGPAQQASEIDKDEAESFEQENADPEREGPVGLGTSKSTDEQAMLMHACTPPSNSHMRAQTAPAATAAAEDFLATTPTVAASPPRILTAESASGLEVDPTDLLPTYTDAPPAAPAGSSPQTPSQALDDTPATPSTDTALPATASSFRSPPATATGSLFSPRGATPNTASSLPSRILSDSPFRVMTADPSMLAPSRPARPETSGFGSLSVGTEDTTSGDSDDEDEEDTGPEGELAAGEEGGAIDDGDDDAELDATSPVHRWLAKAALTADYVEGDGFFDFVVGNVVLEDAYAELEGWCLKARDQVLEEED